MEIREVVTYLFECKPCDVRLRFDTRDAAEWMRRMHARAFHRHEAPEWSWALADIQSDPERWTLADIQRKAETPSAVPST